MKLRLLLLLIGLGMAGLKAQSPLGYQSPPSDIADLLDAPLTPSVSLSPSGEHLLLLQRPSLPPIEEVSEPELRLAGLRINPRNFGPSRSYSYESLALMPVGGGEALPLKGLPDAARIGNVSWSTDGSFIAFTLTHLQKIELWVADVAKREARLLSDIPVNNVLSGSPFHWLPGNKGIVVRGVIPNRIPPESDQEVPSGPVIQENAGSSAPVRTYQDLLRNPHDEALFRFCTEGELLMVDLKGKVKSLGLEGMIMDFDLSPDGKYLLVEELMQPFSYLVPYYRFAQQAAVFDLQGKLIRTLAQLPLAEDIPKGFDAVRTGPRALAWRADAPATLVWVEAQDGGDPQTDVAVRDQLYLLTAPFSGDPVLGPSLALRYGGIQWGGKQLALVYELWRKDRKSIVSQVDPSDLAGEKKVIFDRNYEDRYNDPGRFSTTTNAYGRNVLQTSEDGKTLFLIGNGASPEGDLPFLDAFDLATGQTRRLWRCEAPYYETPSEILDPDRLLLLTRRESQEEPSNYYLRDLKSKEMVAITHFSDPYPSLRGVSKELIRYTRNDSLPLSGTLYLPAGYDAERDGPLPVLMWAYPEEFKSADAAGQISGSPYRFIRMSWASPLYWLVRGYAILDDPGMPIVGEGETEPNDHFRDQLVANAAAAIDKLVEMGVADRNRIAVGGHSYGAFMTANLLAHSDLFAAGIARSGAYNRTLTPFGFQSEERTYWEAPEVYYQMSPFSYADKIKEPLLLIHGEADNNSGTFPMQSERFYHALKGHGATTRLVMLPHESHSYRARESVMHMLWEMDRWLEKYVKGEE